VIIMVFGLDMTCPLRLSRPITYSNLLRLNQEDLEVVVLVVVLPVPVSVVRMTLARDLAMLVPLNHLQTRKGQRLRTKERLMLSRTMNMK
jgi:hypothetical protein